MSNFSQHVFYLELVFRQTQWYTIDIMLCSYEIERLFRSIAGVFGEGHATNRTSPCATSMVGQRRFIAWLKGEFYTCQVQPYASVVCSVVPTSPLDVVKGIAMLGHYQYQSHCIHVWYIYIYHTIQEFCVGKYTIVPWCSCGKWSTTFPSACFKVGDFQHRKGCGAISHFETHLYTYTCL